MNTEERMKEIRQELSKGLKLPVSGDYREVYLADWAYRHGQWLLDRIEAALEENQRLERAYQELLKATAYWGYVGV